MSQNNSNSNTTEGQEINDKPPMTYKEQLDEAAIRVKNPQDNEKEGVVEKVVDKVSQYVPAVGNILGKGQKEDEAPLESETRNQGAPARPHHDTQIEEFVRDQHRSNTNDVALGKE